jgi:putative phage-type endonuclease
MEQNTKEWLDLRKNHIGASDAPIIMGVSPWRTPYQLWQEKLGLGESQTETQAMRYGKQMEEPARQAYEKYTGNLVCPEVIFHPTKKFMMASLDGLSFDRSIAVEIKNSNSEDHRIAKDGKIPEKYYPQVQHQLACLGINMLHYFSYRDGDGVVVEVERDHTYIESLYKEEESFWNKVLNLDAPDLGERDFVKIEDENFARLAAEWGNLTKQLALLEKKEKEYRAALIARANGQNARGNGITLTKIVRKGAVDYKKVPELIGVDLEVYRKEPVESWRISQ